MNTRTPIGDIENELKKLFDSFNINQKVVIVSFILSKLELSYIGIEQRESEFNPYSYIKLYLYRKIKGFNYYNQTVAYLKAKEEDAFFLGFYKDENNQLNLPTKRAFNKFFKEKISRETKELLDRIAEIILRTVTERNLILDIDIIKRPQEENKKYEISREQKINEKSKEVAKLIKKVILPKFNILINKNSKYKKGDIINILAYCAENKSSCNKGCKTFKAKFSENAPSGDTLLYHLNKFKSREELEINHNEILYCTFKYAIRNYNLLKTRKVDIAIDIHPECFYGKDLFPYTLGGKYERGTSTFFKFLTCSIVCSGIRFVIFEKSLDSFNKVEIANIVDEAIKKARELIRIRYVFLDRGFESEAVIKTLKSNKVKYLMPKIKRGKVLEYMRKSEGCNSRVIKEFKIKGETTTLVLVRDKNKKMLTFSTNINIPEQLAYYLFKFYGKRWGIETCYSQLDHDFKIKTTTRNYNIRLFQFLFSICLFNFWVLVNMCIGIELNGKISPKPLICSSMFIIHLYKTELDLGG